MRLQRINHSVAVRDIIRTLFLKMVYLAVSLRKEVKDKRLVHGTYRHAVLLLWFLMCRDYSVLSGILLC